MKRKIITIISLLCAFTLGADIYAGSCTIPPGGKFSSRFLIVIDGKSYSEAKEEVLAYKQQIESEGLGAVILVGEWNSPEVLREEIRNIYNKKPVMEGAVFIGNIPVVRVRNFQHATTAFKMDEDKFPLFESSVTSDRYYDDLDLEFEFVQKDEKFSNLFYYKLKESSPQVIESDFYSARMLPPSDMGIDPYELLRRYLRKVVKAHKENNQADRFMTFNGHGYNSDCLTAWQNEQFYMREVIPEAFKTSKGNSFYNFRQNPWMKFILFDKMQIKGTDVFIFHEHGDWDTQYINGDYPAQNMLEFSGGENEVPFSLNRAKSAVRGPMSLIAISFRNTYRRYTGARKEAFRESVIKDYGFKESFFDPQLLEETRAEDSLFAANVNISLTDLKEVRMQPKLTIFDACYNGSFHRPGYVAGYHVFGDGNTIVAQGNTVNVLQDKWTLELLGMITEGARIGFWQKEFQYLESHLIGDPTYRFYSPGADNLNKVLSRKEKNGKIWEQYLSSSNPNLQALAIKKLSGNPTGDFPRKLLEIFNESPYYSVRMEALKRLVDKGDSNMVKALSSGLDDPYELIRRNAARYAGFSGSPELIVPLVETVLFSNESQRVQYSAQNSLLMFDPKQVTEEIRRMSSEKPEGKVSAGAEEIIDYFNKEFSKQDNSLITIMDKKSSKKERISAIRSLRNNNYHRQVNDLINVLKDSADDTEVRTILAEALGWFSLSIKRGDIIKALAEMEKDSSLPEELRKEIIQSVLRLSK
jgi:HEAT repeat protein